MSSNDRWMPLYVSDYMGDTMHLSTVQHGAYMLLLMHYWKHGPLPDDAGMLAAIAKADDRMWKTIWPALVGFFTNGDGRLHQKRMDWERRRWTEISGKRRDAGKRGAEAKHRAHPPVAMAVEMPPVAGPDAGVANATVLPDQPAVDNLANATNLPGDLLQTCQPETGNCQPFATAFASVPLPVQKNNLTFLDTEVCAREQNHAHLEQDQPTITLDQQAEVRQTVAATVRDLASAGKRPQGRPATLTVSQQKDHAIHGEVIPPVARRGPVDAIRTPDEMAAEVLGISIPEATAWLAKQRAAAGPAP